MLEIGSAEELNDIIRSNYNVLNEQRAVCIAPATLAWAALESIDPQMKSPPMARIAAFLELKQLARAICRARQLAAESSAENGTLFEGQLQPRYPTERDGEDVYVLREFLSVPERFQNSGRLRREAGAKLAHADALDAETKDLLHTGKLLLPPELVHHDHPRQIEGAAL